MTENVTILEKAFRYLYVVTYVPTYAKVITRVIYEKLNSCLPLEKGNGGMFKKGTLI